MEPRLFQQQKNYSLFNFTDFDHNQGVECSFFSQRDLNYCVERIDTGPSSLGKNTTTPVWNLNSLTCYSTYRKICDQFLLSASSQCSVPGCGPNSILDPHTLQCLDVSKLTIGNETILETNDLPWHSHSVCSYQSQCRLVELGIMKEYELNCFCDEQCIYFNDCCEDSPYQATEETKLPEGTYFCKEDASEFQARVDINGTRWGVMEVNSCPQSYLNLTIKTKCEEIHKLFTHQTVPVTDPATGIRYDDIYMQFIVGQIYNNVWDINRFILLLSCFT